MNQSPPPAPASPPAGQAAPLPTVGFIGLGKMGQAMAINLLRAGYAVRAWNRSPLTEPALQALTVVATPGEVFTADIVFTMLADDAAIREVVLAPGVLPPGRPALVHVVTATISVAFADELRDRHAAAGLRYLSAPVFGRPEVAQAGELTFLVAGEATAIDQVSPLFEVLGKKTWRLGPDPKQANAAKIAGNLMLALAIETMAEALVLTESTGLSREVFLDLMLQTQFAGSRAYENYSQKILKQDYAAGFRMALGLKDLGLAAAAAAQTGQPLPLVEAVRGRMAEAVAAGLGDQDWSAVAGYTLRQTE